MAGPQQISPAQATLSNERQSFFQSTLQAASRLSTASGLSEAQVVFEFVRSRLVLAMPLAKGGVGYWTENFHADPICLVVVLGADRWVPHLGELTAQYSADRPAKSFAGYTRSKRAIYMAGSWKLSEQVAGLALLHEARHAWGHMSNADDEFTFDQREDRVRRFEVDILAGVYGDRWSGLVETAAGRVADLQSGTFIRGLSPTDWPLPRLAEILGPAQSDTDVHYRTGLLRRAAEYELAV